MATAAAESSEGLLVRPAHDDSTELGPETLAEMTGSPASEAIAGMVPSGAPVNEVGYNE